VIGYLEGKLLRKEPDEVLVVAGGVGYRVFIPLTTYRRLPETGAEVALEVLTVVSQDAIRLFGFLNRVDLQVFELLLGVSKIGPRTALAVLSRFDGQALLSVLMRRDLKSLQSAPGIGKRTAERILMECRDAAVKLGEAESLEAIAEEASLEDPVVEEAVSALVNLGYPRSEALPAALAALARLGGSEDDPRPVIREALRAMRRAEGARR
jgi:Holliday junction DNA helicase RuvA